MSENLGILLITILGILAISVVGIYVIRTMKKIANKDKQQILLYIVLFYLDFWEVMIDVDIELKNTYELDEVARIENNGVYVIPSNGADKIKIRDLMRYCKENNKESSQLSKSEIEKFYR